MKNRIGNIFMILGVTLMLAALSLFAWNTYNDYKANTKSQEILYQVKKQVEDKFSDPNDMNMTVVEIGGYGYVGYLSFPSFGIELPVMSELDNTRLKMAPCRYYGTTKGDDLVIAAHNYKRHFGFLKKCSIGDKIIFTDMDGVATLYEVVAVDILTSGAVEEMNSGEYDLTLFTCTYGGKNRITVRCDRIR